MMWNQSFTFVLLQLLVLACGTIIIIDGFDMQTTTSSPRNGVGRQMTNQQQQQQPPPTTTTTIRSSFSDRLSKQIISSTPTTRTNQSRRRRRRSTQLTATVQDLDMVALVAGQENYGLALVVLGEGLYSFFQAPTNLSNLKVLFPPLIAAILLFAVSGPMITSGEVGSAGTGLWIATAISLALGASYIVRLLAPSYETLVPKEVAVIGLIVAMAGFFSFGQNLIVDGFVTLPSIPLPQILPMPPSDNDF